MNIKIVSSQLLIIFFLVSCASTQEKLISASLTGDENAIDNLLDSDIENINEPVNFYTNECPGHTRLNPLQVASCKGHLSIVNKLLDKKADPNIAPKPIFLAFKNYHSDIVQYLIERGTSPDTQDENGSTILIHAAYSGNTKLVKFILKKGASINIKNNFGNSATMLAANIEIAQLLITHGGDIFSINNNGENSLHLAVLSDRYEMVEFFVKKDLNIDHLSNNELSALDYARSQKNEAIINYLEEVWRQSIAKNLKEGDNFAKKKNISNALVEYALALNKASDLLDDSEINIRAKIIQYGISQNISLSEKAREHFIRSNYLLNNDRDIKEVVQEMKLAVKTDPWWADGYYNLGILLAKQSQYNEAIKNLNTFLAAVPNDPKARETQDKIHEFKIAQEEADKINAMSGRWTDQSGRYYNVTVDGNKLIINGWEDTTFSLTLAGNIISGSVQNKPKPGPNNCTLPGQLHPVNGNLDFDARGLTLNFIWSSYDTRYHCVDLLGNPSNCCLTCDTVCDAVSIIGTNDINLRLTKL